MDDDPYVYRETGWFGRNGYLAHFATLIIGTAIVERIVKGPWRKR